MARQFPRFIIAKNSKAKNPGPFIIHCIEPKFICKVYSQGYFPKEDDPLLFRNHIHNFRILEFWDEEPSKEELQKIVDKMSEWIFFQDDIIA